jgi:hypothetical protein
MGTELEMRKRIERLDTELATVRRKAVNKLLLEAFGIIVFLFVLIAQACFSEPVTFQWDANPEPFLRGYKLYSGKESGVYDNIVDVGNVTEVKIEVGTGVHYYALTAYGATEGNESDFTTELRIALFPVTDEEFFDDFKTDTVGKYFVRHTNTKGGRGSLVYDAVAQRMKVKTEDNVAIAFSREMPAKGEGVFRFLFEPIIKFPVGGVLNIRLSQDANNYISIIYTDGYPVRQMQVYRNGVRVGQVDVTANYIQGNVYIPTIQWNAKGVVATGIGDPISIAVDVLFDIKWFTIEVTQQDCFIDNLSYANPVPVSTPLPPATPVVEVKSPRKFRVKLDVFIKKGQ